MLRLRFSNGTVFVDNDDDVVVLVVASRTAAGDVTANEDDDDDDDEAVVVVVVGFDGQKLINGEGNTSCAFTGIGVAGASITISCVGALVLFDDECSVA